MVLQKARSIQGFRFVVKGVHPHKKTRMLWLRLVDPGGHGEIGFSSLDLGYGDLVAEFGDLVVGPEPANETARAAAARF